MIELNHTYFSDTQTASEITLHDDGLTIKAEGYYKGKPHFVKYDAINASSG